MLKFKAFLRSVLFDVQGDPSAFVLLTMAVMIMALFLLGMLLLSGITYGLLRVPMGWQ